jgi:precorrin-6A/cobalt-precorrin-6A reductase
MKVLVLGGTSEGRYFAQELYDQGFDVIYSIAGLVRSITMDCRVISGGFTQFGGLVNFVNKENVDLILDATHPYAINISNHAVTASHQSGVTLCRFLRPAWSSTSKDHWILYSQWSDLLPQIAKKKSIFFSVGQIDEKTIQQLAQLTQGKQKQIIRTAVAPGFKLPESTVWIQDIGPFDFDQECQLLTQYRVDAVVSKNSGGTATWPKIEAARLLTIPVYLLKRPQFLNTAVTSSSVKECLSYVVTYRKQLQ